MEGVVSRETLGVETGQRSDDLGLVGGELVLDDGVDDRVQVSVGKPHPRAPVERFNQGDALALIELEPPSGIELTIGVVLLQLFTLPNGSALSCERR
jgi:hypothetical protein